ncbi:MAG: HD domain-containing phosphohydrolase [bacterium]
MSTEQAPKILVVDDEKYICNIIVEALASDGCQIVSMSDAAEALEYIHHNPVDLVLSDLVMGEYSGVQILEATLAEHEDAIVILMTAHPTVQTAISVLKAGAYDFLVKPFKLELLRATIKRGLEHRRVLVDNVRLRAQVEFLKVASAAGTKVDLTEFLEMVAGSCQKETDATAVGILEIDPDTHSVVREVFCGEVEDDRAEVLDVRTVEKFYYTKSAKPHIKSQRSSDDEPHSRIYISQPVFSRHRLHGVINLLIRTRFDHLTSGQVNVLTILANSAASAIANQRLLSDLETSYIQAIRALANAIEARDECTAGHTDRVCVLAESVARRLGWDKQRLEMLVMGCTLHDIGKIGVPDRILNKPERLSDDERQKMQAHPEVGLMMIDGIDLFKPAVPYVIAHHERYDGTGYPNGLAGEDIPIEGRLLSVVDTFDAILSDRPYRPGANLKRAVSELIKYRSIQFDPVIVDAFLELISSGGIDFEMLYGRDEDLQQIRDLMPTEKAPA